MVPTDRIGGSKLLERESNYEETCEYKNISAG